MGLKASAPHRKDVGPVVVWCPNAGAEPRGKVEPVAGDDEKAAKELQDKIDAAVAEATEGLKKNRDEALREAKAAKAKLASYDGVDPEEHRKLKAAAEEADRKKAAAEGNFQALEKQLVERHQAELATRDAKVGKLTKALERRLVQAELTGAIARAKGDPDLLLPHASRFIRVKETDDDFEAFVADAQGNPRIADGKGTPMTFDQLVEQELKPKYPRAFDGSGASGGGAAAGSGGSGTPGVLDKSDPFAISRNVDAIIKGTATVR